MLFPLDDQQLGKYQIEKELGQGSYGIVYLVQHKTLHIKRAVKVLRHDAPGVGSTFFTEARNRFQLEASLGARLNNHPYLIQVYDLIVREDLLVLEMEYAPGGSLAERLQDLKQQKQAMEVGEALRIACDVSQGLAALHELDIVHRDLKPANILFDGQGTARLADLGLAQVPGGPSQRSQLSNPGWHPGTPGYMSPEQSSQSDILKPPSDVYALGLVLFEMLTGRNYSMLPPGTRARSLRLEIPIEVDDLLTRMLSKNPEERPWDGGKAAVQLLDVLLKISRTDQPGKSFRIKELLKWGFGAAALLTLVVVIGLGLRFASDGAGKAAETALPTIAAATFAATSTVTSVPNEIAQKGALMRLVPGGSFDMGSENGQDDEKPVRQVTLAVFYMDVYEVTNTLYKACVDAGACQKPISSGSATHTSYYGNSQYDNYPVISVDWGMAKNYCAWRGARLPTEAEWEYAARGIDGRIYPWGDTFDKTYANYDQSGIGDTTAVGIYPKGQSLFGMYDMAGNVWEWVSSEYKPYPYSAEDGREDLSTGAIRVLRGGAWNYGVFNIRSADRYRNNSANSYNNIGFRCARSQ